MAHGKRKLAQREFVVRAVVATIFFGIPKVLTLNAIPTPFDFNCYHHAEHIAQIRQSLLRSSLEQVEYSCHLRNESYDDCWIFFWYRGYSLSNLSRYGLLDKEHVAKIKHFLAQRKKWLKPQLSFEDAESYKLIKQGRFPSYVRNKEAIQRRCEEKLKTAEKALLDLKNDWECYRDTIIRARFPDITIDY